MFVNELYGKGGKVGRRKGKKGETLQVLSKILTSRHSYLNKLFNLIWFSC